MTTETAETTKRTPAQERALKLFVVLTRAANAIHCRLHSKTDLHGLTLTEFSILEALYHKGPLLLGDVQRKILLSSGGVTYTVDRLAEKGLVERRECTTDRRARYAALTPKGEALIAEIFPSHAERIEDVMSTLTSKEQAELTDMLRRLGLNAEK
ncbi:MAG TPA: MarR family transcriptional regulator [Gemmatimonadaceae bacterium]|nr:MarR family transcriptional regulator [Gemmatimonadaceae bacterium]